MAEFIIKNRWDMWKNRLERLKHILAIAVLACLVYYVGRYDMLSSLVVFLDKGLNYPLIFTCNHADGRNHTTTFTPLILYGLVSIPMIVVGLIKVGLSRVEGFRPHFVSLKCIKDHGGLRIWHLFVFPFVLPMDLGLVVGRIVGAFCYWFFGLRLFRLKRSEAQPIADEITTQDGEFVKHSYPICRCEASGIDRAMDGPST